MGALTNYRYKRDAESYPFNNNYVNNNHPHISKKLKSFDWNNSNSRAQTKSSVSRLRLYPQQVTPIVRVIQSPCLVVKGFTSISKKLLDGSKKNSGMSSDRFGELLSNYYRSREAAKGTCRYVTFDDEVKENDGSADSSVEEIAVVESRREEESNKLGELKKIRDKYTELDGKDEEETVGLQHSTSSGSGAVSDLSLNERVDVMDVDKYLAYKKLLDASAKRNARLDRLSFDIKFQEEKRALLKQLTPAKKAEAEKDEELLVEPFQPLTKDDEEMVDGAFSNSSRRKVLVTHENSNITITGEVLRCLRPRAWLNDEVINVYHELLKEREKKDPKKFLKCHFFNTFFYKKLISGRTGYDYKSVRRWTTQKKLGYSLLECDKIFVPVHQEIHWCLAVINKKEEKFQYLDSLGGVDKHVLRALAKYFVDEVKDKNGEDIDVTSWQQEYVTDLPNQENGFDCGVFMIKYADFYSRDIGLCFKQEHMPYFRLRTAKEILKLRAD